jgi:hypothetical protein
MRNFLFRHFGFILRYISSHPPLKVVLTTMVLSDRPKERVDTLFFFGRAKGDDNDTIFNLAAKVYRSRSIRYIAINGTEDENKCGHTRTAWTKRLDALGVNVKRVLAYKESSNTTEEAKHMIDLAVEYEWQSAAILAQPHQVLRCMCALVKAMEERNYWMKIYCFCPESCDWFETTRGSGNRMPMPRWHHIGLEYSRVLKYGSHRHIATLKEVLKYYQRRHLIMTI